jgi:hypothetical protein
VVEAILAARRFLVDDPEIGIEASCRARLQPEAGQLRMPAISPRMPLEDRAG